MGGGECVNVAHKGIVRPVISLTEASVVNKWKGRSMRHVKAMVMTICTKQEYKPNSLLRGRSNSASNSRPV